MPVPSSINDLSTTAGSNSPAGSDTPIDGDNFLRALSSFIATLRDKLNGTSDTGTIKNPVFSGVPSGTVVAGEYTPTATNAANCASITVQAAYYKRIGVYVDLTVALSITPTSSASGCQFYLTLPVSSALAATTDAIGSITGSGSISYGAYGTVIAEYSNDRLDCNFFSATTSALQVTVTATYKII